MTNKNRESLPVFKAKSEIINVVRANKCVIFVGDTACGKSTQIPQYLLEWGIAGNKCIGITQPRRVAAITIAEKVAQEVKTSIGDKVGYSIRFENATSCNTKIKYVTDGMLLRESINDALLSEYSTIILDEAHERTLCNDILFGIVKLAQINREISNHMPLKIIVMSATMEYNHFSKYFNDAPVYFINGREYSIKILNALKTQDDYIHAALVSVFQIHQNENEGDILVFCTGQEEIDSMVLEVKKISPQLPTGCLSVLPCALYAAMPSNQQTEIFKPTPKGYRKIIFSTNIAETSVTIPGIKFVIDTGMVKAKTYNPTCGLDVLKVQKISKAQADQRAGRAGRQSNGLCYRLYTTDEFKTFTEHTVPEIQRSCLSNIILQMTAIGIHNIAKFDFLDKPTDDNINAAIKQLKLLGAVTEENGLVHLTDCGRRMVSFPLDPRFSKMIITSRIYRCTDEILTIIALLSVESVFFTPSTRRDHFAELRRKFESSEGDCMMLLNVYKAYHNAKGNQSWCLENYINSKNIKKAMLVRKQLSQLCGTININPCSCNGDSILIRKCLTSGLFMNAAELFKNKIYKTLESGQKVKIHPSSCLFKSQPSYCIYTELIQTSKTFIRNVATVDEEWLKEVAPSYFEDKRLVNFKLMNATNEDDL